MEFNAMAKGSNPNQPAIELIANAGQMKVLRDQQQSNDPSG
jgi:hypothetical protein